MSMDEWMNEDMTVSQKEKEKKDVNEWMNEWMKTWQFSQQKLPIFILFLIFQSVLSFELPVWKFENCLGIIKFVILSRLKSFQVLDLK
jgi:hypothetical protein